MLYTPLLPEAASGTLEPRHTVVPLRVMCPHAELLLGDLGTVDLDARTATVDDGRGEHDVGWQRARARARRRPANRAGARARGARALVQVAAGRDQPAEPRAATARGGRRGAGRGAPPRAAHLRLRRRRLRGRRGARGALRPRRTTRSATTRAARHPDALGARRRSAEDPAGDPAAARRVRGARAHGARRRDPCRHDARVGDGRRGRPRQRHAHPDAHARLDCRRPRRTRCSRELGLPLDERGRVEVDEFLRVRGRDGVWALGDCARVPNTRSAEPDPPTCQHALRQARRLAKNLAGHAGAVRLPDARPGRDARPLQGHRGRARRASARLRRLVRHAVVSPLPAAARAAAAARRRRLDGRAPLPPRRRRARASRPAPSVWTSAARSAPCRCAGASSARPRTGRRACGSARARRPS